MREWKRNLDYYSCNFCSRAFHFTSREREQREQEKSVSTVSYLIICRHVANREKLFELANAFFYLPPKLTRLSKREIHSITIRKKFLSSRFSFLVFHISRCFTVCCYGNKEKLSRRRLPVCLKRTFLCESFNWQFFFLNFKHRRRKSFKKCIINEVWNS